MNLLQLKLEFQMMHQKFIEKVKRLCKGTTLKFLMM